jgi:hypothetical protein
MHGRRSVRKIMMKLRVMVMSNECKKLESWIRREFYKRAEEILKKQAEEDEKFFLYGDPKLLKPEGVIKYRLTK